MTHTEARISNERLAEMTFDLDRSYDHPGARHSKAERNLYSVIDWTGQHRGQIALTRDEWQALNPWAPQALRAPAEAAPVAYIQAEVLAELAKFKDAKATVSSGLLKRPFGNPVALYARPLPNPSPSDGEVSDRVLELARDAYEDFAGEIASKQALRLAINCALQSSKGGQP